MCQKKYIGFEENICLSSNQRVQVDLIPLKLFVAIKQKLKKKKVQLVPNELELAGIGVEVVITLNLRKMYRFCLIASLVLMPSTGYISTIVNKYGKV